jgi:tetratricopeptide (TPR) repeat protein
LRKSKFIFALTGGIVLVSACRTAAPKKNAEMLDASSIKGGVPAGPSPDDPASAGDPSSMWSPSDRRASAMYHYLVAQRAAMEGDVATAETHFEASYNLDPNSFTGSRLAKAKIIRNARSDEGLSEARRMALLYPLDSELRLLYGQSLLLTQDYAEAEIQLKKSIELDQGNEEAYMTIVRCYQLMNKVPLAIEYARKLTKVNPASPQAWTMLSRILLTERRAKEALEPARRAWELQENNPEFALIYALTLDLNKRGREAVKLYEQLYRFNPGNQDLVQRMVTLYKELGNLETALTLVDDMIENSRDEVPGLKIQKVLILWALDRNQEAHSVLSSLDKELPESDRVTFMRAFSFLRLNRQQDAVDAFGKIQDESPLKIEAMKQTAALLSAMGRVSEALDICARMAARKDVNQSVFVLWAELLSGNKNIKDSLRVLDQGLEKYPDDSGLLYIKGAYLERSGNRPGAEKIMRQLIAKDPKNAAALNFVGYMLAEDGRDLDEAETLVKRALEISPDNGGYVDSLGWVYYQRKEYKKAHQILERAVELAGGEGVIWEHLGDTLLALGDKKGALEKFKEALKRDNEPKDRERIQKKHDKIAAENG